MGKNNVRDGKVERYCSSERGVLVSLWYSPRSLRLKGNSPDALGLVSSNTDCLGVLGAGAGDGGTAGD